jgi:glucose-specific phosphotransferase system IIA component
MLELLNDSYELMAPVSGKIIQLKEVPDEVFSTKLAIELEDDIVVAPVAGKVVLIFKTNHAFCIRQNNGVEFLVHVGLDTVKLNGEGYERLVEEGAEVKLGQPILRVDRKSIIEKGYLLTTLVLITTMDMVENIECLTKENVQAGKHKIISYKCIGN